MTPNASAVISETRPTRSLGAIISALPEPAALKVLYLTVKERRTNKSNPTGQINGWKSILNVLAMTYGERLEIN